MNFFIGGPAVVLDAGGDVTLTDGDSPEFNGGNVTALINVNHYPGEDVLVVGSVGNISTSGSNVIHSDGVTIGTFAGGSSGAGLVITLNANATVTRTRDLLSALQYRDTDAGTVNTAPRTIRITVDDGDGGSSTSASQDVTVSLVRAPLIDLDGDDSSGASDGGYNGSFSEGGGAVATADTDSTIIDDGTFKSLTVILANRPDGTAESLSSTYGSGGQTVNSEAVTIGTYNSGTGALTITVNDASTSAATMQMLMESIRYYNVSDVPDTASRNITYMGVDNSDNAGPASTAVIIVIAVNDPPVFSGLDGTPAFTEGGPAVTLDGNVTIADLELDDADNYNGAVLTLVRTAGADPNDQFSAGGSLSPLTESFPFHLGGADLGTVTTNSGGTLVLTFGVDATPPDVDTVLQSIRYSNANDAPAASVQIDWTFSDGNSGVQGTGGDLTATGNTTVSVTAVNDVPVFTGTPTISGVSIVGQTLSLADIGQYDADGDPVVLIYQWAVDGIDIPGATSDIYRLTRDDENKIITCTITLDDGNGGVEIYTTDGVVVKSGFPWPMFLPAIERKKH